MARDDLVQVDGVVKNVYPGGKFSVRLVNGVEVSATLAGRLRKFQIRIIVGDKVTVGISPYDTERGIIVGRERVAFAQG